MTVRLSIAAAFVAGLLAVVEGVVQLGYSQPDSAWGPADLLFEVGFALSLLASIVALQGLPTAVSAGRTARIGAVIAQAGFGVLLVSSIASAVARQNVLTVLFPVGLLLALGGLLVLAIGGAIGGRPRWVAVLPFVGFVLSIVVPVPALGDVLLGLAWAGVAVACTVVRPRALAVVA